VQAPEQMAYFEHFCARCCRITPFVTDELSQVGFASWYGLSDLRTAHVYHFRLPGHRSLGLSDRAWRQVANPDRPVVD